jgi:tetratricopeptide (TPR) repeat protein
MAKMSEVEERLSPLAAAQHLGISSELLFQYTKASFARASRLRSLKAVEHAGVTLFSRAELEDFDSLLRGPWSDPAAPRPAIPKAILDHLRAESLNQCARCGSGIGVDTAHIRPWSESRSHHPANLIRLCSSCHREHDAQHSLSTADLLALKARLIERTRANLTTRIDNARLLGGVRRPSTTFVGRDHELLSLIEALRSGRSIIVTGGGGIGKTELLVHAVHQAGTGRPVFWIDVEQHRTAADILLDLRTAVGGEGIACPEGALAGRLDTLQACVVFDGVERATLEDLDGFEDTLVDLHNATAVAQFVLTSQVMLHGFSADIRMRVSRLDDASSRALLTVARPDFDRTDLAALLAFCDGHTLTLRLAAALIDHYGGASNALGVIKAQGVKAIRLPGRQQHSRANSLELCLAASYEAVSADARRLLWTLAEAPAGLFTHYIDGDWLAMSAPIEALAELRRWHLVDFSVVREDLQRAHMLSPIRAYVTERGRRNDSEAFAEVVRSLVDGHGMVVAVLELNYDDPNDTPYVLQRYGEELPNLLHTLDLAREYSANTQMVLTAVSIVRSLMRYFFVLGLSEDGARVMRDAADLALAAGHLERASGLIVQSVALAHRAGNAELAQAGLALAERLEAQTDDARIQADIAFCRGLAAREVGDHAMAEHHARSAFHGYQSKLKSALNQAASRPSESEADQGHNDLHNDISHALGLLGFSLLAAGKYEEAAKAYRHSLQHERGASVAVNRGQALHQIGNCESHLGRFRAAAECYVDAAKIFHFVGMEEYLGNALGELGYALLDTEAEDLLTGLAAELFEAGLVDLGRDVKRVFDLARPLDHQRCVGIIRKLFGSIVLFTIIGEGERLGEFCIKMREEIVDELHDQIRLGGRDREEIFPLMMIDLALSLGFYVAQAEWNLASHGEVPEPLIGEMLRAVCNSDTWARKVLRVVDWLSALLTRRWRLRGASPERLWQFVKNFDDDVVDYLDLAPESIRE